MKKQVAIRVQKSLVPWMIAVYGLEYTGDVTADVVRQMVAHIVVKFNIKGLGSRYASLVEKYPLTADKIAEKAKYAALRAIRCHRTSLAAAYSKLLSTTRNPDDRVENLIAALYFPEEIGLKAVLDIQNPCFAEAVKEAPNPAKACIWETKEGVARGYNSIVSLAPGSDSAVFDVLFTFLGMPNFLKNMWG